MKVKVTERVEKMQQLRQELPEPVGFVPTMGCLHEGHAALVRQARAENATVVVSIFINPTQFDSPEDLRTYPRDIPRDLEILAAEGVDVIFIPFKSEMYPPGFNDWVEVEKVTERLEGASRPGHFRGVATVVNRLFNIVEPTKAYFGQKDAQQAIVIKKMVADLNMNIEIVVVPTVRESDGLAMSTRNAQLTPEEHEAALVLYRALTLAQKLYNDGERDANQLRQQMTELIQKEPLAHLDYVSVADNETLDELDTVNPPALVSLAARVGRARLIDNIVLE